MSNRDVEKCVKALLKVLKKNKDGIAFCVEGWDGKEIRDLGYALNKHAYEINWNQKLVDGELQKDYSTLLIGRLE